MKIGFIGAGKMAEAIMAALLKNKVVHPAELFASDVSEARRNSLKKEYGINVYGNNALAAGLASVVFLAVKPQQLEEVLAEIAPAITRDHLVISIAAGKKLARMESLLPDCRIIRVMPNIACLVSQAMSVFAAGSKALHSDKATLKELLSNVGAVMELPEDLFDIVTAVSGSGPAFFAYILEQMVNAAVGSGLSRQDATLLAAQTMIGTGRLLIDGRITPGDLIASVSSAKGTTAEGMSVLGASDVGTVLQSTVAAAERRSRELSGV